MLNFLTTVSCLLSPIYCQLSTVYCLHILSTVYSPVYNHVEPLQHSDGRGVAGARLAVPAHHAGEWQPSQGQGLSGAGNVKHGLYFF